MTNIMQSSNFYQELSKLTYSNHCYISGMLALNIADYENHTGDWHSKVFWNENSTLSPSHIMGSQSPIAKIDTNIYFGDNGIFHANDVLQKMGIPEFAEAIFAANHARSIADLVIYFAKQGKNPCAVIDFYSFDDFMEAPSDKEKVFALLEKSLNITQDNNVRRIVDSWLSKARVFAYE